MSCLTRVTKGGTLMGSSTSAAPSGTLALRGSKCTSNVSVSQYGRFVTRSSSTVKPSDRAAEMSDQHIKKSYRCGCSVKGSLSPPEKTHCPVLQGILHQAPQGWLVTSSKGIYSYSSLIQWRNNNLEEAFIHPMVTQHGVSWHGG